MKTLTFIIIVFAALWFTRPSVAIENCLKTNFMFSCQYLDKE